MSDSPPQRFFISYAREDERVVRQLIKLVTVSGAFTFLDQDHIIPGVDWRVALADAIAEADALIVFWSQSAGNSAWVRREWEFGLELGKRVIPVQMDSTVMPKELSRLQAIDLRVLRPIHGLVPKLAYYSLLGEWEPDDLARLLRLAATKLLEELVAP